MSITLSAQILSIDKIDTTAYIKKAKWEGNISAGLEIDKQQQTLYDATNGLDISLQKMKELLILSCGERFTYNGPQDFLNSGYLHLRWRHSYKEQLHPESYVQYQWDSKRGLRHRFVTGENLRYNFWHLRMWEMTFATGLMYENETWNYDGVDSSKIPTVHPDVQTSVFKSNSYIKLEGKLSENAAIAIAFFWQAKFDDFFQPRTATNISLDVNISKHFSLGLKFASIYDFKPVVPIANFYYNLSNNLVYKF